MVITMTLQQNVYHNDQYPLKLKKQCSYKGDILVKATQHQTGDILVLWDKRIWKYNDSLPGSFAMTCFSENLQEEVSLPHIVQVCLGLIQIQKGPSSRRNWDQSEA